MAQATTACFHCGEPCPDASFAKGGQNFCCQGCLAVHELLAESGLGQFYELNRHPGARVRQQPAKDRWTFLDQAAVQERVLDFTDGKTSRATFHIPAIHCIACVWLLENLFRLNPAIGKSQVNFPRRELAVSFRARDLKLSELVALLAGLGYEPSLTLGELEKRKPGRARRRQWLQVGVAGFAFGNIMLFSIPGYFGLDNFSGPVFRQIFGWLSLGLATPALLYSAADYWRSALVSFRQRVLTLDVPIALGLAALYAQSTIEVLAGRGGGYFDSLTGLIFFLLCGKVFQQKTHDRMVFDRDYKCFFPLAATRRVNGAEESVAISELRVGDRLLLRHQEIIPADARLVSGRARVDYSFVTGEAEPVAREAGDHLYAGGRQTGALIEVETVKPVSQSYLTSLWNHASFRKEREDNLNTLTNRYSRAFTPMVLVIAVGAGLFWWLTGDAGRGARAFTSVLIVACPCALALAAPFALGTAQRLLARLNVFLKNPLVLERMAEVSAVVFDKTGTLTATGNAPVQFEGGPRGTEAGLTAAERRWVQALARQSTHPHSLRLSEALAADGAPLPVSEFTETAGCGIKGTVAGHAIQLGSPAWLESNQVSPAPGLKTPGNGICVGIDGVFRGTFTASTSVRPQTRRLLTDLGNRFELALLSGDNERERETFRVLFGPQAHLRFNQGPLQKLAFIENLQSSGRRVMMVGDGLNDAGALQQSDVGVAVVEKVGVFSPASDVILEASRVPALASILAFARQSTTIVRLSFGISAAYNIAGISIAAAGVLSPLICAVLMPLSSVSVVLFACGSTHWAAKRLKQGPMRTNGTRQETDGSPGSRRTEAAGPE